MSDTKTCNKCFQEKKVSQFDLNRCVCTSCRKEQKRQYYKQNINYCIEQSLQRHEKNKDRRKEQMRQRHETNKDRDNEQNRQRYEQNKDYFGALSKERCRQYRENLTDGYIRTYLKSDTGFAPHDITPEIIEAKREQLRLHRLVVQLQHAIIEVETTEKETP